MLGDLPDYQSRIKKRVFLFTILFASLVTFYFIQRADKSKPSEELKTGVKVLTDAQSVANDL